MGRTTNALLTAAAASAAVCTIDAFSPSLPSSVTRSHINTGVAGGVLARGVAPPREVGVNPLQMSSLPPDIQNQPTELPDSLGDAASIAANACDQLAKTAGTTVRCRVDFDTSIGDETYTTFKSSTEFMQQYVTSLCLASVDGVREWKMDSTMKVVQAKADLRELKEKMTELGMGDDEDDDDLDSFGDIDGIDSIGDSDEKKANDEEANQLAAKETELLQIIANEGAAPGFEWAGSKVRIYMPDEGSAALARRDWRGQVPPCVEFASCGGVQVSDVSKDVIIIFFCPRASEAEFVEEILYKTEENRGDELQMTVMVNPLLVDMGVTGFGMAGRRLRERLIDGLTPAYYLRTLPWGALTRVWPQLFTVWQEDEQAEGGYRMIKAMDRLPSNPEVEDIYDIENGDMRAPQDGFGLLNALGDFVNGMTRL